MTRLPIKILLLGSLLTTGVGCEFFSTVAIPSSDTTEPWAVTSIWVNGDYEVIRFGDLDFQTHDATSNFFPLGAIYDPGGAKQVDMIAWITVSCEFDDPNGPTIGVSDRFFTVIDDSKLGVTGTGNTTSDGLYLWDYVRFDEYGCLDSDFDVVEVSYVWQVTGTDMADNEAFPALGVITYTP